MALAIEIFVYLFFAAIAVLALPSRRVVRAESPPTLPPAKSKGSAEWRIEVVSQEVAERGLRPTDAFMRECTVFFTSRGGRESDDAYLRDFVLIQIVCVRSERTETGSRERKDTLRIGAVEIQDPEFDTKLSELRSFAEERIAMLNAVTAA